MKTMVFSVVSLLLFGMIVFSVSCEKDEESSEILYPENGYFGKNILSVTQFDIEVYNDLTENNYSFRAELPSNAHLKIIVNDSLPETALIGRAQGSSKGWVSYREGNKIIYYADGPEIADMILRFHETGKSTINIYENYSTEPDRIKIISW